MKKNRVFIEASGSLVSASLISELKKINIEVISSDISKWNAGASLSNEYIKIPNRKDPNLWKILTKELEKRKINWVIPSFDETLRGWTNHQEILNKKKINILLSPKKTIETFTDKWLTYKAFLKAGIPTPATSLKKKYDLIKPRKGRGSKGILITRKRIKMKGLISQQKLTGKEFTVDCLFDLNGKAIYIVSRLRNKVIDGKSVNSQIFKNEKIKKNILILSKFYKFVGPINLQGFIKNNKVKFTELNPRIAGGMVLSWAGTENWFKLWFEKIIKNKKIKTKKIKYNLKMERYYSEIFY